MRFFSDVEDHLSTVVIWIWGLPCRWSSWIFRDCQGRHRSQRVSMQDCSAVPKKPKADSRYKNFLCLHLNFDLDKGVGNVSNRGNRAPSIDFDLGDVPSYLMQSNDWLTESALHVMGHLTWELLALTCQQKCQFLSTKLSALVSLGFVCSTSTKYRGDIW